ncbi:MAG: hypothetical protein WA137_06330 [Methanothrix sp.]
MPRKDQMDKTTSFYFPSKEILDEWRDAAEGYGSSLNNYIFEMAERGRHSEEGSSRPDLVRENSDLKTLNRKLEDEIKLLKINIEQSQAENYKLRYAGFANIDADDPREYDAALVTMLKRGRVLDSQEILSGLGIDPRDSRAMKLIANQLDELKRFGLVRETHNGWRWV